MRIAITNSWPNLPQSAEKEFLRRAAVAANRVAFEFREVITSDDIELFKPDVVIASHEFTPKLTRYPTLGAMWSPSSFYFNDKNRLKSILSYDGYLVGSEKVAQFIGDLTFSTTKKPIISDFLFLPSTYKISEKKEKPRSYTLFYAGVHWDGARHGDIFTELDNRKLLNAYGPESSWSFLQNSYRGQIPFDGNTLLSLLSSHGVALCLHKDAHKQYNTPSMRLFEAASSGSVIISDDFPFVREYFGDAVLYLPKFDSGSKAIADQIEQHMEWIRTNPNQAAEMASHSREIFENKLCLERIFSRIPEFVDQVKDDMGLIVPRSQKVDKSVQYIVRIGSRPKDMIRRCLKSLAEQTYQNIHLILVSYRHVNGIDELIKEFEYEFRSINYIEVQDSGFRSSALWAGLNAVSCDYFAVQDDDDTLHPNHVRKCINTLNETDSKFVYSGVIKHEESPGVYFSEENFAGSEGGVIKETRRLQFLDDFSQEKMIRFDNYIQSNTWLASKDLLDGKILGDPKLVVAEDVYLYNLLMAKGPFATIYSPTAEWNWRSSSEDNSMIGVAQNIWGESADRIRRRLSKLSFDTKTKFGDINPVSGDPLATEVIKRDVASVKKFMALNQMMPFNFLVNDVVKCSGVSFPEELGSWSDGKTSVIAIPIKTRASTEPLSLVISGQAAIYPIGQEINVTVSTLDMLTLGIYTFKDTSEANINIEIPHSVHEHGDIKLRFEFSKTFNPLSAGVGNDDRELGFLFRSLGLFELQHRRDILSSTNETLVRVSSADGKQQFSPGKYPYCFRKNPSDKTIEFGSVELADSSGPPARNGEATLILEHVTFDGILIGNMIYRLNLVDDGIGIEFREEDNMSFNLIRWDKISPPNIPGKSISYLLKVSGAKNELFVNEYNYWDVLWQKIQTLIFLNFEDLLKRTKASESNNECLERNSIVDMARLISLWASEANKKLGI